MFSGIPQFIDPWFSVITGVISFLTFMYVTVGGKVIKKKVVLRSLGSRPVQFRVQLRNFNVQQITNIISARYFNGGIVPPHVRQEIIELTAPTAMKELKERAADNRPSVFINLTNHPSSLWSAEQRSAAMVMGEIVDIPFPNVGSSFDEQQIQRLSEEYEQLILQKAADRKPVVHIMGEMNLTYALVNRLRGQGVTCVASTTERIVEDREGQKISTFRFVQFRQYE